MAVDWFLYPEDGNLRPKFGVGDILYNFCAHPCQGCAEMDALYYRGVRTVWVAFYVKEVEDEGERVFLLYVGNNPINTKYLSR